MSATKYEPATGGAAGSRSRKAIGRPKLTLPALKKKGTKKTHWLRVNDDGSETWFRKPPKEIKTLRVQFVENYQLTFTYKSRSGPVPPPGEGWLCFDNSDDAFTVWRRADRGGAS